MNFAGYDRQEELKAFYDENYDQLEQDYEEMLLNMQDSPQHIDYMRTNDDCFFEWCAEQFYKTLETA